MKRPTITAFAEQYLRYRHDLGFKLETEGPQLLKFASFADAEAEDGRVDIMVALRWARLPRDASPLYWARRLEIVRCFARYLAVFDSRTQIPPKGILGSAHRRVTAYIYTDQELVSLVDACARLKPVNGLRPHTYSTLFGLLACTGLRISEALHLQDCDVDLNKGILSIRETKFHKSRLVPLHTSAWNRLSAYRRIRACHCPRPFNRIFFLSDRGAELPYSTVRYAFQTVLRQIGLEPKDGKRRPRIYDLRHTFASRRLAAWQRNGVDITAMLPALSTYMGHVKVSDTYWYISAVPELFAGTASAFERFAHPEGVVSK